MLTKKATSKSRRRFLETVSSLMAGTISLGFSDAKTIKSQIKSISDGIEVDTLIRSTPIQKYDTFLERKNQQNQYVLFHEKTSRPVLEMNHTGQAVWNLCDGSRSPHEISRIIHQIYSVDPHEAYVDCLCFLAELSRKGLIQL